LRFLQFKGQRLSGPPLERAAKSPAGGAWYSFTCFLASVTATQTKQMLGGKQKGKKRKVQSENQLIYTCVFFLFCC